MSSITNPQEKKHLAYKHERRNRYGQNAKASRKLIPLRKKKGERAQRRATTQIVAGAKNSTDLLGDDSAENRVADVPKKRWRKAPDSSLADAIIMKKNWRVMRYGRRTGKAAPGGDIPGWSFNADLNSVDQEGILKKKKPNQMPEPMPGLRPGMAHR